MAISFNNIPDTLRVPGVYTEIDNSRALTGLLPRPHKVLLLGQKTDSGSAEIETLYKITSEAVADGYFGENSILGRMASKFKNADANIDVYAIALSADGGVKASGTVHFSVALSHAGGIVSTNNERVNLMVAGIAAGFTLTSGWSVADVNSAAVAAINNKARMPVAASTTAGSALVLTAVQSGTLGNGIDIRLNYYEGQSNPTCFADSATIAGMAGGSVDPDVTDAWAVIENEKFEHIVCPYTDDANFSAMDDELSERFKPLNAKQGYAYMSKDDTLSSLLSWGDSKNSAFVSVLPFYDAPNTPEEWAAVFAAVCAGNLNIDPARPLHTLELPGLLPPKKVYEFSATERNLMLYDGLSTWTTNANGNIALERVITTYQVNSVGSEDPSYLNIQTMATLDEIRYQYAQRMLIRFLATRVKLASDTYPVQPGQAVVQPKTIRDEIIALFTELRDTGLIENLDEFITNLRVERSTVDHDRVDVLLAPDLINQFRILATKIQFIL